VSILQAILLGIIQGLSEFLPISSTAHLTVAGKLLGLVQGEQPEAWTAFIAVMQLGTMASIVIYFFKDLWSITISFFKDVFSNGGGRGISGYSRDSALAFYIFIGTVPVAVVGYSFNDVIEGEMTKNLLVIAYSMVLFALFLWLAEKSEHHTRTLSDVTWKDALVIGLAQVLALIPGASRSGTTITAGMLLGMKRGAAARFSFLLSVPAVLASGFLELFKVSSMLQAEEHVLHFSALNLVVATVVACVSGYVAIAWLLSYLIKHTTMSLVWYRIVFGVLMLAMIAGGIISSP
jgi:undecaprenyl-diphosphatase